MVEIARANSTLYPGKERTVHNVHYPVDDTSEDLEEEEIHKPLVIGRLEVSTRRPAQHTHPCTRIRTLQLTSQIATHTAPLSALSAAAHDGDRLAPAWL